MEIAAFVSCCPIVLITRWADESESVAGLSDVAPGCLRDSELFAEGQGL